MSNLHTASFQSANTSKRQITGQVHFVKMQLFTRIMIVVCSSNYQLRALLMQYLIANVISDVTQHVSTDHFLPFYLLIAHRLAKFQIQLASITRIIVRLSVIYCYLISNDRFMPASINRWMNFEYSRYVSMQV